MKFTIEQIKTAVDVIQELVNCIPSQKRELGYTNSAYTKLWDVYTMLLNNLDDLIKTDMIDKTVEEIFTRIGLLSFMTTGTPISEEDFKIKILNLCSHFREFPTEIKFVGYGVNTVSLLITLPNGYELQTEINTLQKASPQDRAEKRKMEKKDEK